MPEDDQDELTPAATDEVAAAWERRRRRSAVFGDVLPETTSDEREPDGSSEARTSEEWLKAQVPPHHGG